MITSIEDGRNRQRSFAAEPAGRPRQLRHASSERERHAEDEPRLEAAAPPIVAYCIASETVATWRSHDKLSSAFPPPRSINAYLSVSTGNSGVDIVIFTRPRSRPGSYVRPHWPLCILTINSQESGFSSWTFRD